MIRNHGGLTFSGVSEYNTAPRTVTDVIAADVTGDNLPDVVLTTVAALTDVDRDGSLEVMTNLGGGMLGTRVSYNVGTGPTRVVATEMDGTRESIWW